MKEQASFGKNS